MAKKGARKQFCLRGHDTFICGRDSSNRCKECGRENNRIRSEYKKQWYQENKEIIKEQHHDYYETHKEQFKVSQQRWNSEHKEELRKLSREYAAKRRQEDPEACNKKQRDWYEKHKEEIAIKKKKYRDEHPEIYKIANLKNQTNRQLRIPPWVDWDTIYKIYEDCPKNKTVDHIIPLQGKLVSGLHVPWNLQYLTKSENSTKGNSFDGTLENNGWRNRKVKKRKIKSNV